MAAAVSTASSSARSACGFIDSYMTANMRRTNAAPVPEATKRADPIAGDTDAGETRRGGVLSTAFGRRLMTVLGSSNQTWASTTSVISEARVMTKYGRKA